MIELDKKTIGELCLTVNAIRELVSSYALIGANAILLHGVHLPRATRDLDFVVIVKAGIEGIAKSLRKKGFRQGKIAHRLYTPMGTQVDLLPMKPGSTVIEFTDGESLSSPGFQEALKYAEEKKVEGCLISVAPISVLVALKVLAATRRYTADLQDALACMEQYAKKGTRRFEEVDWSYFTDSVLTFEEAGAFLLGSELATIASPATLNAVKKSLSKLIKQEGWKIGNWSVENPASLLRAFELGIKEKSSPQLKGK